MGWWHLIATAAGVENPTVWMVVIVLVGGLLFWLAEDANTGTREWVFEKIALLILIALFALAMRNIVNTGGNVLSWLYVGCVALRARVLWVRHRIKKRSIED